MDATVIDKNISFTIPEVADAVMQPDLFQVSHTHLGWSLSYVGESCEALITSQDAAKVIRAQKKALREFLTGP